MYKARDTRLDRTVAIKGTASGWSAGEAGRVEPLFRPTGFGFQPARDGRRFLVWEREGGQQAERPMVVIQNWAAGRAK